MSENTQPVEKPAQMPGAPEPQENKLDEILHEDFIRLGEYLRENGRNLTIGLSVVLVAILATTLYNRTTEAKTQQASTDLMSAQSIQELENVVTKYGATPSAPLALLKLAKDYFDTGDYEMASDKYAQFIKKHSDHPLKLVAELGQIHCSEAKGGRTEDTLAAYQAFRKANPSSFLAPQAMLGEGRCLEKSGRLPEAQAVYEDFIAAHPDSQWKALVEEVLDVVKKQLARGPGAPIPPTSTGATQAGPAIPANPLSPVVPTP